MNNTYALTWASGKLMDRVRDEPLTVAQLTHLVLDLDASHVAVGRAGELPEVLTLAAILAAQLFAAGDIAAWL